MTTQQWSINTYRSTSFQRVNKLRSTSWSLKENKSQGVSELLIQTAKRSASGLVYRLICTRPFHHASISINNWSCVHTGIVWREIAQNWFEVVHTHKHPPGAVGWEGLVNKILVLTFEYYFTYVSVDSSPYSYLFTSVAVRIPVHSAPKSGT